MGFEQFGLIQPILRAVAAEGYATPSPIQVQAIPPVMQGRDLIGLAQTGTGKTAAFALPVLNRLAAGARRREPRCLVLAPTRELAAQVGDSFRAYGRGLPLRSTVVFGGVGFGAQTQALRQGVDILVACPGRLLDLMQQGLARLDGVEILILDEADRMLDMGFLADIRKIAAACAGRSQTLLFSATMPREIRDLAGFLLRDPVEVAVAPVSSAAESVAQSVFMVPQPMKQNLLAHILQTPEVGRAIVFTRTKHGADKVAKKLAQVGIGAEAIHGNKSQNQRLRALDAFRTGACRVLVASDIAARGLDVDGITHVINFEIPNEPETYVHRIGRTGRAGATGTAISFCGGEERAFLADIERIIRKRLPIVPLPPGLPAPAPVEADAHRPFQPRPHGGGQPRRPDPRRNGSSRHNDWRRGGGR